MKNAVSTSARSKIFAFVHLIRYSSGDFNAGIEMKYTKKNYLRSNKLSATYGGSTDMIHTFLKPTKL